MAMTDAEKADKVRKFVADLWHQACEAQKASAAALLATLGHMAVAPKILTMPDATMQLADRFTVGGGQHQRPA